MKIAKNQSGVAHLGLLVICLLIVTAVGFAAYRVSQNQPKQTASNGAQSSQPQQPDNNDSEELDSGQLDNVITSEQAND